jgi:Zn-dependent protease with chaperone function
MLKTKLSLIIFILVYAYSFLWNQINLSLSSFGQDKVPVTLVENQDIQQLLSNETGSEINAVTIFETPHPFGMMIGIPTKPLLVLSRGLYETFSQDEMEYVVLHEAGHYVLWHGVIELVVGLILLVIGIVTLRKIKSIKKSLLVSVLIGLLFGALMIQLGRAHELQTDNYALRKMNNPNGMIEATKKFRDYHGDKYSLSPNPLMQFLFYRGNPYDNRIKMAELEIEKRK